MGAEAWGSILQQVKSDSVANGYVTAATFGVDERYVAEMGPATRITVWRNTASTVKIWSDFLTMMS